MEWLIGLAMGVFASAIVVDCNRELPASNLRRDHCEVICAGSKAEVHSHSPSLCVCTNGKTYPGKAPEFYRVQP